MTAPSISHTLRVLFLNPVGELGGGEMSLVDLIASLRALAPDASISLVTGSDGPLIDAVKPLSVDVHVLPLPTSAASVGDASLAAGSRLDRARFALHSPELLAYSARLARIVRARSPSVIHSNGIKMHLLGAAVRPRGTPLVWHVRDFVGTRSFSARLIRMARHRAHVAIANSHAVAEDFRAVAPDLPVRVMHNGVDTQRFSPEGRVASLDVLASMPPLAEGGLRVGLIATYARWKGHDTFFECAKRLLAERRGGPPMRFYVVGSPIYTTGRAGQYGFEELRALAEANGIASHVGFVPFQLRPDEVYRALDIVVHASTRPEPFGRTIVEAMASGRAVVVSRAGGAVELYEEGVDALGAPPGDAGAMAACVAQLSDASLRSSLGCAARQTAERRFSRERLGAELLAIYADLFRE